MKKEEFINDILEVYNKYGYINRKTLENEIDNYNVGFQLSKYGGLKNICRELGIEYRQYSRIDPEEIKKDFLRVYEQQGKIGKEIYEIFGKYSSTAITSSFGSYSNLFNILHIPVNIKTNVTKDDIINDFFSFYKQHKTTSSTKYRKYGNYSESTINNLFGSWVDFLKAIGMKPMNEKVGKKKMIDGVKAAYDKYGFLSANIINQTCDFTYQGLSHYFSMEDICKIVGDENAFAKSKSSGSKALKIILESLYDNVIEEATFDWLKNPNTGNNMYVDYYIPKINIAFEYDGQQHNKFVKYFFKTYRDFFYAVYRDRIKERLLSKHGIALIRIDFSEPLTEKYIKEKIQHITNL